ncbi:hypothetical protein AYI68_g2949 [Smittium mucronatum]|uniref:Uncharacterized protein n=1 Tax=Smittium mucronatum TaxID=133383 RepID=A0A1R0H1A7_9FUNG|nr:hypothetical protein AYI68_g2949 [Smittium mucronatum]
MEAKDTTKNNELQSFLALAGYYRKFARLFFYRIPETEVSKKCRNWLWNLDFQEYYGRIKSSLFKDPLLAHSYCKMDSIVATEASINVLEIILSQNTENSEKKYTMQAELLNFTKETNKYQI